MERLVDTKQLERELLIAKTRYYNSIADVMGTLPMMLKESISKYTQLVDMELEEQTHRKEERDRMKREREENMKWVTDNVTCTGVTYRGRAVSMRNYEMNDDIPTEIPDDEPVNVESLCTDADAISADISRRRQCGCDNCVSLKHPCLRPPVY